MMRHKPGAVIFLICVLLAALLAAGCDIGWGGDTATSGEQTQPAGDDILETTVTGTVIVVAADEIDVETDTGVVLTATVPEGETVAIDDQVQLMVTLEGSLETNWDLTFVEFDQKLEP